MINDDSFGRWGWEALIAASGYLDVWGRTIGGCGVGLWKTLAPVDDDSRWLEVREAIVKASFMMWLLS
jgi:hypothetical protein